MNRQPSHEETLQYLEIAQRSAGMGYISLEPATMELTFSEWVRELLGLDCPVLKVDRVAEFVVPEEREGLMLQIAKIVEERQPFEFETVAVRFDGMPTRIRVAGNAVYTGETLTGFYAIAQDIEGFAKAEAAARASAARAQAELSAGSKVIATLSHEIRTPLTGIIGIIEQLRREPRAEERARGLALIEQSAEALLETLDGVLRSARARTLGNAHQDQSFDPVEVARRVVDLFRPLARRKGISLRIEGAEDGSPVLCLGHPAQLQQILSNLVSNAIKFTSAGHVQLTCASPRDGASQWRFVVRDTGSGIASERLEALFAAFGNSNPDTLGRSTGAGLGLSITKRLVDDMGGALTIESQAHVGTTIFVDIPLRQVVGNHRAVGARGELCCICASASRAIVVSAVAEDAGFAVRAKDADLLDSGGGSVLVCDEEILAAIPAKSRSRFSSVIEICEAGDLAVRENPVSAAHARISAARLAAELREALSRVVEA